MERLGQLAELTRQKKQIEAKIKELSDGILEEVQQLDCDKINLEDDQIKISFVPESSYQSLDLTKVKNKEPKLYEELLEIYPKTTIRKAHLKVKLK